MKKVFVRTQNVKNFISLINNIQNRAEGVPGMALVYGEPGLGKSQTALWWAAQNDAVFIRSTNLMTGRWLLEEIVDSLGETPYYKSSDLFTQCINQLTDNPRILIIDEIDYLTRDAKSIETLRDIHDKTNVPIILLGMGKADRKLMRYKHLYDRISEVLQFMPFSLGDIKSIVGQLAEVVITEKAIDLMFNESKRFRQIVRLISKAEKTAEANSLKVIDDVVLKEIIKNDQRKNMESH